MFFRTFLIVFAAYSAISLAPLAFFRSVLGEWETFALPFALTSSCIIGAVLGSILGTSLVRPATNVPLRNSRTVVVAGPLAVLSSLVFFSWAAFTNRHGLVATDFDARFGSSASLFYIEYFAMLSLLCVAAYRYLSFGKLGRGVAAVLVVFIMMAVALGYRSPIVIMIMCVALIRDRARRAMGEKPSFRSRLLVGLLAIVAIVAFSAFSVYRTTQKYDFDRFYYSGFNLSAVPAPLTPFIDPLAMLREDQVTVDKLVSYTKRSGYLDGGLFASNFITLLPGEQLAARNIVGSLTTARVTRDGRPWSITPTIQGALWLDGGWPSVALGGFLIGLLLSLSDRLVRVRPTALTLSISTFVSVNIILLVHTGYPDATFYLVVFLFLVVLSVGTFFTRLSRTLDRYVAQRSMLLLSLTNSESTIVNDVEAA